MLGRISKVNMIRHDHVCSQLVVFQVHAFVNRIDYDLCDIGPVKIHGSAPERILSGGE
jgi:hypothetical protein